MNRRFAVVAVVAVAALGLACQESTVAPRGPLNIPPGHLRLAGGISFDANGAPTVGDKAVVPATFAVAILDSVSGPYILAYNARGDATGDFFILSLSSARTGTFGPCADGPSTTYADGSVLTLAGPCQARLLQDVRGAGMAFSSRTFLQSVGGTVSVESVGDRLVGTVTNLQLSASLTGKPASADTTIASGEFDLPLVRGATAQALSECFLSQAVTRHC